MDIKWKIFLCNQRAMDAVGDVLRASGQVFPVKVPGGKGQHYLHSVTTLLKDALDPKRSTYRNISPDYRPLDVPAFHAKKIGSQTSLFKIPQNYGLQIYCVERTGDPKDGEFKALVEHHRLKGLKFRLVWSDEKSVAEAQTPAPPTTEPIQGPGGGDRPLTVSETKDIAISVKRACKYLKLSADTPAMQTQRAILDAIDAILLGKKKATQNLIVDLAVNLGSLWGQTVCDVAGWQWFFVTQGSGEGYAVATPDRSHYVAPMNFVLAQLRKRPPQDNTSMLLFNMIREKSLPAAKPRAYVQVG